MTKRKVERKIRTYLEHDLPYYLELLHQMVSINSFTANPDGISMLSELTIGAFAGLGFRAETIQSMDLAFGKHLLLTKPGKSKRKIGFISHLDTVYPPEEERRNDFSWREEGHRVYGPGTLDIKGGTIVIFMILAALKEVVPKLYDDMTWLVLLDATEERGGLDFGQLCLQHLGDNALAALVFEGGKLNGKAFQIVTARKGMAVFKVTVEGKASHSGSAHVRGASAIVQMAEVIRRIAAFTDYERDITFNVGVVSGGTVTNRVPHYAEAQVEMRAFHPDIFEEGIASMLALNQLSTVRSPDGSYTCRVNVEILQRVMPWSPNPASDRLLHVWQEAAEALGMSVEREERGGLSDGNLIWQQIPTIDGLGPSGGNAHCSERSPDGSKDQEFVDVTSLVPKALLNTLAILKLIDQT